MAEKAHSKLSASSASRWLSCPKSVALERQIEDEDSIVAQSIFAQEGTIAHEVAEIRLRAALGITPKPEADKALLKIAPNLEMLDYTGMYIEECLNSYEGLKLKDPSTIAFVELRVEFTEWVPEGFGTCDFIAIGGKRLIIRDLKYGKGVPVSAVDNPQIRLYALGAIQEFGYIFDIEEVEMHIDQPRLNSYTTEVMSIKDLLAWGESIKGKALDAFTDKGEFNPGDHCRFCKVRATCRARANHMLATIYNIINKK